MKRSAKQAKNLFVVELTYKAELGAIDAVMAEHVAYLKKYYDAKVFLVSGRKVPRDGGIILAVAENRTRVDAIAREDPFFAHGLCDFRIVEFRPSQRAATLDELIG